MRLRRIAITNQWWTVTYWVDDIGPRTQAFLALRQSCADSQWYITKGLAQRAEIIRGPYPSKEAVEMQFEMGLIEL